MHTINQVHVHYLISWWVLVLYRYLKYSGRPLLTLFTPCGFVGRPMFAQFRGGASFDPLNTPPVNCEFVTWCTMPLYWCDERRAPGGRTVLLFTPVTKVCSLWSRFRHRKLFLHEWEVSLYRCIFGFAFNLCDIMQWTEFFQCYKCCK